MSRLFFFFALLVFTNAEKLLRVDLRDENDQKTFRNVVERLNLDVWSMTKIDAEVAGSEQDLRQIKSLFSTEVILDDVDKEVRNEMSENNNEKEKQRRFRARPDITSYFAKYSSEISPWMDKLAADNDFVYVDDIGKTYEGREMKILKLSTEGPNSRKPAVFITAGIHAREWLSTASIVYMINKMVMLKKMGDRQISILLAKYDFFFSPVTNPDGYEHTFKNSYTRKWRKTMRPHQGCLGADPNRNWDIEFGKRGASPDPCHIIYPGPKAFSEDCTRNIRDFALRPDIKNRIKLYYDVHAYGQMYFVPFAHNSRVLPRDDAELRRVAAISNEALRKKNGRRFLLGSPGEIIYDASGSTMDWFKLKANVKYAYVFEVFPHLRSSIGFLARPQHIQPSGEEITAAILKAAEVIEA